RGQSIARSACRRVGCKVLGVSLNCPESRGLRWGLNVRFGSKADIRRSLSPCPLYPRKRTFAGRLRHVRFVPIADITASLDHLVGAGKERRRHIEAERLGGSQVNEKLILGRLLNRKFSRISPPQDAIDIDRRAPPEIDRIRTVGYQAAIKGLPAKRVDGW